MPISSVQEFQEAVARMQGNPGYRAPLAFGICQVQEDHAETGRILSCNFPVVNWKENFGSAAVFMHSTGLLREAHLYEVPEIVTTITAGQAHAMLETFAPFHGATKSDHRNVQLVEAMNLPGRGLDGYRLAVVFEDVAQQSVPAAYLKLSALSLNKIKASDVDLNGIQNALKPLAWGDKAYDPDQLRNNEVKLRTLRQYPKISRVGKLPLYLDHVTPPSGVEIADNAYVPLGVYLAPGTKVMSGAHIDLGSSTGDNCVLGPNSVTAIPLGNGCTINAGVTIHADANVYIRANDIHAINALEAKDLPNKSVSGSYVKGADLAGVSGLYFTNDTDTGKLVARLTKLTPG